MMKLAGFECPGCGARKAMSQSAATPATGGVKLRRRICVACGAKLETIEVTQQSLFELIREWFGDDQAEEIASEVFAEAIEVRKILNTASAQRYRAKRRKSPRKPPLPWAEIRADWRPHKVIAEAYGISRSMVSHIKAGRRPRESAHSEAAVAEGPTIGAAASLRAAVSE